MKINAEKVRVDLRGSFRKKDSALLHILTDLVAIWHAGDGAAFPFLAQQYQPDKMIMPTSVIWYSRNKVTVTQCCLRINVSSFENKHLTLIFHKMPPHSAGSEGDIIILWQSSVLFGIIYSRRRSITRLPQLESIMMLGIRFPVLTRLANFALNF